MKLTKDKFLKDIIYFPVIINKVLLKLNLIPGLLYGFKYLKRKRLLQKGYIKFTEEQVVKMVNRAINDTPYYTNLYPKPISSIDEFTETVGFINRNTLTEHFEDLVSSKIHRNLYNEVTTGGTSGKPVSFLIPKDRYIVELSAMHSLWNRTGWNYHTRAVLRNHKIPKDKIYLINPVTKELIFDNFRINPEYVKQMHEALLRYHIQFIHAYPSAAYQFCLLCKEMGLDLSFIRAFLCGSEGIIDFQKKLIVDELGLKLYSFYGHSEKLVIGGYCEYTDHYHMEQHYGYFELIGEDNMPIHTPGKFGEIVGTTLHNNGMSLIRYRTGDYAEYVGDHCEACGREMPVIKNVQGRWDKNQIFRKDGTYITTTALNLHDEYYKIINGLQYEQEEPGSLKILIIKGNNFRKEHEDIFFKHYSEAMGPNSEVVIEYVNRLISQPNGKFLQLISKINR
jgi:phenylacetate-CoA ligase